MRWQKSMKTGCGRWQRGLRAGALGFFLATGCSAALAQGDQLYPETQAESGKRVQGPISAMDGKNYTLVLEGRRFTLAREVEFDGMMLEREQVFERLGEGNKITVIPEDDYNNTVRRIRTRLK
ncbi:MAG: hypothetical protein R6W87_10825 [Halospina sp.]